MGKLEILFVESWELNVDSGFEVVVELGNRRIGELRGVVIVRGCQWSISNGQWAIFKDFYVRGSEFDVRGSMCAEDKC